MAAENCESHAVYKVSSMDMVKNILFKERLFVAVSLVFSIVVFVLPVYILYFSTPMKDSDFILFCLQYSFIVVFLILFIYSAIEMHRMRKTYPVYVCIDHEGIKTISSDGVKNLYPYREFRDRTHINIYFSNDSNRSFHSMKDFVGEGISYIEDMMRERYSKKASAPKSVYIHILKPMKVTHIFRPYIWINVHVASIGGTENLKKMLNEWKYNYKEYLKGLGETISDQTDDEKEKR